MDLGTVKERLATGTYRTAIKAYRDVQLVRTPHTAVGRRGGRGGDRYENYVSSG